MAKLHGLTMGLDVCATFHMGIAPAALQETTRRIVELAAPAYLMAVAGNSDPMLGYLTTSFREHPQLRRRSDDTSPQPCASSSRARRGAAGWRGPAPEAGAQATAALYAVYVKEGGDRRTTDALREEGAVKVDRLRARGFDIGMDTTRSTRRRRPCVPAWRRSTPRHGVRFTPCWTPASCGGVPASHSRSDRLTRPRGISRTPTLRRIDSR